MNPSFEKTASVSQSDSLKAPPSVYRDSSSSSYASIFSGKNFMIMLLTGLLILSFLGVNLLAIVGTWIQSVTILFAPLVNQILSLFGYTAGTILDKTGDVATDVAKSGIDIAGGAVQSVADLLKNASTGIDAQGRSILDNTINTSSISTSVPMNDDAQMTIQKPITSQKTQWCLVGEYQGKRGCVAVTDQDKCLSGQVFPEQKMCLNPTNTVYRHSAANV